MVTSFVAGEKVTMKIQFECFWMDAEYVQVEIPDIRLDAPMHQKK